LVHSIVEEVDVTHLSAKQVVNEYVQREVVVDTHPDPISGTSAVVDANGQSIESLYQEAFTEINNINKLFVDSCEGNLNQKKCVD
jgi:hypothetical protein